MNSAAAVEPAKKRVRINEDNNTVSSTATPIYSSTNSILASDLTLLPAVKAITNYYIDKYLSLSKRKHAKENAMIKLYDPTYVPKSARLNFTVGVSDKASASDKYEALAASVKNCNDTFETKQKENILKAAELELEVLSNEKKSLFCEAFYEIAAIFFLWKTKSNEVDEKSVHTIVQETTLYDIMILKHVFTHDYKAQFNDHYNKMYPTSVGIVEKKDEFGGISDDILSQIPMPTTTTRANTISNYYGLEAQRNTNTSASTVSLATTTTTTTDKEDEDSEKNYNYDNDYNTTYNNNNDNDKNDDGKDDDDVMVVDDPTVLRRPDIMQLSRLLTKSFVTPWIQHLAAVETRMMNANLAKYATSRIKSKATDKAAAVVANEPSATPQIMSELIKKAVSKETDQLLKKLSKLEQQLSRSTISKPASKNIKNSNSKAKNDTRGEKKTRALAPNKSKNNTNNKSSSNKKTTSSNAKAKPKRKAGDVNNDINKDNKKSSKNNKATKPNGKINTIPRTKRNNNRVQNRV